MSMGILQQEVQWEVKIDVIDVELNGGEVGRESRVKFGEI